MGTEKFENYYNGNSTYMWRAALITLSTYVMCIRSKGHCVIGPLAYIMCDI